MEECLYSCRGLLKIVQAPSTNLSWAPFSCFISGPVMKELSEESNIKTFGLKDGYSINIYGITLGAKCLVWVKNCCHILLDQNFDPSLLINKLWLVFMGKRKKNLKKKNQNSWLKKKTMFFKIANPQYFFVKISWIGTWPWVSRIYWCEGHWCSSI